MSDGDDGPIIAGLIVLLFVGTVIAIVVDLCRAAALVFGQG